VPEGRTASAEGGGVLRWLDVLPCTGIVTERLAKLRPAFRFDVVERTSEVADFVAQRVRPRAATFGWPRASASLPAPPEGAYDVVSCFYRLENLRPEHREKLVADMARWAKPGGKVVIGFVNAASFHDWAEWLRARRGGLGGVEYVLAPEPSIGPFESLRARDVSTWAERAGLRVAGSCALQSAPPRGEIDFRTRNSSPASRRVARVAGGLLRAAALVPGVGAARGRFQYRAYTR
jgi:SAM-dependent methyltransferase